MFIPGYGKRGMGWLRDPKKAWYNWWYNRTSVSVYRLFGCKPSRGACLFALTLSVLFSVAVAPVDVALAGTKAHKIKKARKAREERKAQVERKAQETRQTQKEHQAPKTSQTNTATQPKNNSASNANREALAKEPKDIKTSPKSTVSTRSAQSKPKGSAVNTKPQSTVKLTTAPAKQEPPEAYGEDFVRAFVKNDVSVEPKDMPKTPDVADESTPRSKPMADGNT